MVEEEVLSDKKIPSLEDEKEETKIPENLPVKNKNERKFDVTSAKLKKEKKSSRNNINFFTRNLRQASASNFAQIVKFSEF